MNKKLAIKKARDEVSLFRFGNQWKISIWDEKFRAWYECHARPYADARLAASAAMLRKALEFTGGDSLRVYDFESNGGSWTKYLE
jgi:hypothetical protein